MADVSRPLGKNIEAEIQQATPGLMRRSLITRKVMTQSTLQPTDYASLCQRIAQELGAVSYDYESCVTSLLRAMRQHFAALLQASNPVIQHLDRWSADELSFIIQEYTGFSNAAIHMFLEARIRNHWPALTAEIIRNMDEEMGVLTRNVPHLELMRYGYRVELGIETEDVRYSAQTKEFIEKMNSHFCVSDNAFLAGCLLAFEGTAVDEFRMVEQILRQHQRLRGRVIPADSLTGTYIAGHVTPETPDATFDPEMSHYRGMVEAIGQYINTDNMPRLMRGFFSVCLELNQWWEQVAASAFQRSVRTLLRNAEIEPTDLHRVFQQRGTAEPLLT
jgi:hypothetical protein